MHNTENEPVEIDMDVELVRRLETYAKTQKIELAEAVRFFVESGVNHPRIKRKAS